MTSELTPEQVTEVEQLKARLAELEPPVHNEGVWSDGPPDRPYIARCSCFSGIE